MIPTQAPIEVLQFRQTIVLAILVAVLALAALLGVYTLVREMRRSRRKA
jgi:hypothetical protein